MSTSGKDAKSAASIFECKGTMFPSRISCLAGIVWIVGSIVLLGCSTRLGTEPSPQTEPAPPETDSSTALQPETIAQAPVAADSITQDPTPDPARGRELFASSGCADCHGHHAEGMGGEHADDDMTVPTLAQTRLPLQRLIEQVRHPHDYMRSYGVTDVTDEDLASIYAYLQTLPRPANAVPSVLSEVPPAPTGTIRGVVYYAGTRTPVPDFDLFLITAEITAGKPHYVYDTWFQPTTTTNADGVFEMPLIREGHYVLFESRKMQEMTTRDGSVALVQVAAGQTIDVEVSVPK